MELQNIPPSPSPSPTPSHPVTIPTPIPSHVPIPIPSPIPTIPNPVPTVTRPHGASRLGAVPLVPQGSRCCGAAPCSPSQAVGLGLGLGLGWAEVYRGGGLRREPTLQPAPTLGAPTW